MRAFEIISEKWSDKYKRSINCSNPKGFSQKAHCAGRKKNEDVAEGVGDKMSDPAPSKEFVSNKYYVKFTPTAIEFYKGGDLVYKKSGDYSSPTRRDYGVAKGITSRLWEKEQKKKNESVNEAEAAAPKKVGREFNHLEDLVFTEPRGALRAVQVLKDLSTPEKKISIKWDGNPTVYWGRDEDGTFRMVGKNNWGREEGKSSSPEELKQFIMSRGKGEDWREKFASDMASLWPIFERATPKDFRGYVYGDILFHPGKPYQGADGRITFTPNQTTYAVKGTSEIGRKLAKAKIAVAAHQQYGYFGDKSGEPFENPENFSTNPDLVVFAQTYVTTRPAVNADNIDSITKYANQYSAKIDKLLSPMPGLSDLQTIIYTFVNNQAKAKALDALDHDVFFTWLKSSKVSAPKQQKIAELSNANPGAMDGMFFLIREIMKAKNEVINELDAAEGDITASTGGKPGGEGYVSGDDSVKLVPRDRWTPFRAD